MVFERETNNTSPRKDMPMSRNGGGNDHIILSTGVQLSPSNSGPMSPSVEENPVRANNSKKVVTYKECLKNHAAAIGGNATDGCGEFMPNGEEGSIEALMCSACNCHRNFHRKEIKCDYPFDCYHSSVGRKLILDPHSYILGSPQGYPPPDTLISTRVEPPQPMIMSDKGGLIPSETDENDDGGQAAAMSSGKVKKRFRTKFSQVQKEKMLDFAEKAGWRTQKLDESVVQQFCQEIGIKRRVLKVWMHNNKQSLAKKDNIFAIG
ncbi:zinc-finger homeodomain protein 4-like [Durio zibethinus]|uniref:Zinc-finger homeodomain protein 4-like n=1 Tax=Durio zibethinus TaxID=66656 RepID=A0A6P6BAE8_DURZI|nr:zinc-finger homeodomain protein 4-like [Durio zibethinus]